MSWWRTAVSLAWRFLATLALVAVLIASALAVWATFDSRDDLANLVSAERHERAERDRQVDQSLDRAAELLAQVITEHNAEGERQHTALLEQVARLLDRPAGTRPEPVVAVPAPSRTRTPPATVPRTTTTTVRQCRHGNNPKC